MNRFPKMMTLWTAKFLKDGLNDITALSFGYAAALQFAICKRRAFKVPNTVKTSKSNTHTNNSIWQFYPVRELPFKGIEYKATPEGIIIKIGNKEENATKKAFQQINNKFKKRIFFEIYLDFAKNIIENLGDSWSKKWYKTWQKIRDSEWDKTKSVCV